MQPNMPTGNGGEPSTFLFPLPLPSGHLPCTLLSLPTGASKRVVLHTALQFLPLGVVYMCDVSILYTTRVGRDRHHC